MKLNWCILITLILLECAGVGYLGIWREGFWNAVEQKHVYDFIWKLSEFGVIALILCVISGLTTYLTQYIALNYRTGLTDIALQKDYQHIEGGNQRVQEDCLNYPMIGLNLLVNIFRSVINFGTFTVIVVVQLGYLYLLFPILYVVLGTYIAGKLALPLIDLNYLKQCLEAKFRQVLSKVVYTEVFDVNLKLINVTKKLTYFQSFFNQVTVIIPYVILAPMYFSSKILFGALMQGASALNHIIDSLSYIINSFTEINDFLSCRRRLKELKVL